MAGARWTPLRCPLTVMPQAKAKTHFVCDSCGNDTPKWAGRCPSCRQWNTLVEMRSDRRDSRSRSWTPERIAEAQELSAVSADGIPRLKLASTEANRVLGGGIVPGSLALVAGDPGIGKSTLLLRLAADVSRAVGDTLYVSGEESAAQVRMRADRMGISGERLYLLQATVLDEVMGYLSSRVPKLVVVDSIQTLYDDGLSSPAGSVAQVRECARVLMEWAKARNVPVLLSGHVTKGGDIAGPRTLEHMVDVVLYMEGDPISSWRLLRAVKNRFGSTNEVGVFEMSGHGLVDVDDPSKAFISERREGAVGSVIFSTIEGSRPLLAEVQALTSPSMLPAPRRVANGIDLNRVLLICAVLGRQARLSLANQDVIVNIAGGMRVREPAADLATALAVASSLRGEPVSWNVAAVGEIGLSGEVRRVPQLDRRVEEAARLGLEACLVPAAGRGDVAPPDGLRLIPVETVKQAVAASIGNTRTTGDTVSGVASNTPIAGHETG